MALEEFKRAVKTTPRTVCTTRSPWPTASWPTCAPNDEAAARPLEGAIAAARKGLELNPLYVDIHNDPGTAPIKSGKRTREARR